MSAGAAGLAQNTKNEANITGKNAEVRVDNTKQPTRKRLGHQTCSVYLVHYKIRESPCLKSTRQPSFSRQTASGSSYNFKAIVITTLNS